MDDLLVRVEKLFKEADPRATDLALRGLTHGDVAQLYVALQVTDWHNRVSEEVLLATMKKRKEINDG